MPLRLSTKSLVALFLGAGTVMQIPEVREAVTPFLARHPHLTPVVAALTGVYALLHNPQVQEALGIKETVQVTKETVSVAEEKKE